MNSFKQQGAGWEKEITLLSGRPPAKVSQSQTVACCLYSRRPFLLASQTLTVLSKNIPTPTAPFLPTIFLMSSQITSPPLRQKNYPHYFVFLSFHFFSSYCYHFFHLNPISRSFIFSFAQGLCGVFACPSGRGAALFGSALSFS